MAMIEVKNLSKSYNGRQILVDLNLKIEEGRTVVILGQSGSGKSVLLRQIIGIEKPDAGCVLIDGVNISALTGPELFAALQNVGMLFQASALFDSMTIYENTAFYLTQHPDPRQGRWLSSDEIDVRVAEALEMVGLQGVEQQLPSNLSGGMRKRAALARLIAYRPKVLLYDEPTTGLDPITAMQINNLIIKTQNELGATSIVVTHDLCSTFHVANDVAVISKGSVRHFTSKEDFHKIDDPLVKSFLQNSIPEGVIGA